MRLRRLTEAECYARCYGGHHGDRVSVVRVVPRTSRRAASGGDRLRELPERRLDERGPEAEAA